jgi:hypothetical protein
MALMPVGVDVGRGTCNRVTRGGGAEAKAHEGQVHSALFLLMLNFFAENARAGFFMYLWGLILGCAQRPPEGEAMRQARIRPQDTDCFMHVFNRISGPVGDYPFGNAEKQYFVNLMRDLTQLFTLDVIAYRLSN